MADSVAAILWVVSAAVDSVAAIAWAAAAVLDGAVTEAPVVAGVAVADQQADPLA